MCVLVIIWSQCIDRSKICDTSSICTKFPSLFTKKIKKRNSYLDSITKSFKQAKGNKLKKQQADKNQI